MKSLDFIVTLHKNLNFAIAALEVLGWIILTVMLIDIFIIKPEERTPVEKVNLYYGFIAAIIAIAFPIIVYIAIRADILPV